MDLPLQRRLLLLLFGEIKPVCVELVEHALGDAPVAAQLQTLVTVLETHRTHHPGAYSISPNLADYIFFPISSLLKRPTLPENTTALVLQVLAFLVDHAWLHDPQPALLDQLFPLVGFLGGVEEVAAKELPFKHSIVACLGALVHALPSDYFSTAQRMSFLGDSTTVLLGVLTSLGPSLSQELSQLASSTLQSVRRLYSKVSADQTSYVFPGIVSKVVNFVVSARTLHYLVVVDALALIRALVGELFDDASLQVEPPTKPTPDALVELWELHDRVPPYIKTHSDGHRLDAWLRATAKQLKLSLLVFFKDLLITKKNKVRGGVIDEVCAFVAVVLTRCFFALSELLPLLIDAACLVVNEHDVTFPEFVDLDPAKLEFLRAQLDLKVADLSNKMAAVLFSTDDDRIVAYLTALQFHARLHAQVSAKLSTESSVASTLLIRLRDELTLAFSRQEVKPSRNQLLSMLGHETKPNDIDLPPHINANKLTKVHGPTTASKMTILRDWLTLPEVAPYFSRVYSDVVESKLAQVIENMATNVSVEEVLETDTPVGDGIALWLANHIMRVRPPHVDVSEFVVLDLEPDNDDAYVLMAKSQQVLDILPETFSRQPSRDNAVAYAAAIDAVGVLLGQLCLGDFQTDVIIDYLYPVLEAATVADPLVSSHARATLQQVADNYYHGSLAALVTDNADYLVDSLSMKLLVPSALTPAMPGILLVVLKISGTKLLHQLQDIISQIFILIDLYHGYSLLVEGFFVVFEEIVSQVRREYVGQKQLPALDSKYKPWGIQSLQGVMDLLEAKAFDIPEFDSTKEYFKKPPGPLVDSDDEDEGEAPSAERPWTSAIPRPIYMSIQQIYSYGFRLLSHPLASLRVQILRTLKLTHELLASDYELVMPLVAHHWPVLLSMATLNEANAALELMVELVEIDSRQSLPFLARRFTDSWQVLAKMPVLASDHHKSSAVVRTTDRRTVTLLSTYLLKGLTSYERVVPDLVAYDMVAAAMRLGVPTDMPLSRDVRVLMWVVSHC